MARRGAVAVLVLATVTLACRREASSGDAIVEAQSPSRASKPDEPKPESKVVPTACGEPGPAPSDLPTLVRTGGTVIGEGPLRSEQSVTWGPVQLAYEPRAMIGTRRAFTRGPVVHVEMDRALAGDGPWGTQVRITPDGPTDGQLGPFSIHVKPTGSDDPPPVQVSVTQRACPRTSTWPLPEADKAWAWLSSDGITQHNIEEGEQTVYVGVSVLAGRDSLLSVRHPYGSVALALREDTSPVADAVGLRVGIDRIEPAAGTSWVDHTLTAEDGGAPRSHVRFWIERVTPPPSTDAPEGSPESCGRPHARVSTLPPRLDDPPRRAGRVELGAGATAKLGRHTLSLQSGKDDEAKSARHRHRQSQWLDLEVRGGDDQRLFQRMFGAADIGQARRLGELLLLTEPIGAADPLPKRLRIRGLMLACPMQAEASLSSQPQTLWLSTRGLLEVSLTPPGARPLRFTLHPDRTRPQVAVRHEGEHGEHNHYQRVLHPDAVGQTWQVLDHRITLAAIETGPHTRWDDDRLQADDDLPPAVHVRFDVEPVP